MFGDVDARSVTVYSVLPLPAKAIVTDGRDYFQMATASQWGQPTFDFYGPARRIVALPPGVA